jgi:hypothetical protein
MLSTILTCSRKLPGHFYSGFDFDYILSTILTCSRKLPGHFYSGFDFDYILNLCAWRPVSHIDTETDFMTTAIITMVTYPVNINLTLITLAFASWASLKRIQDFLLEVPIPAQPLLIPSSSPPQVEKEQKYTDVSVSFRNATIWPPQSHNPFSTT